MTITPMCQWIGSGERCGCVSLNGKSYCNTHIHQVYKAGSSRAKRLKDERVAAAVWDIQSEMNAAVLELEAEGFDVYGDSERDTCLPG